MLEVPSKKMSINYKVIIELVKAEGYQLLFLPQYSPDLNDIKHDFSALKRYRMYSPINKYLDKIFVIVAQNSVSFLFKITITLYSLTLYYSCTSLIFNPYFFLITVPSKIKFPTAYRTNYSLTFCHTSSEFKDFIIK